MAHFLQLVNALAQKSRMAKPIREQIHKETKVYGTVAHFRLKSGASFDMLSKELQENMKQIPGIVGTYIYRMDSDPNDCFMAVVFENKDKYWANAKSPEQDARYKKMLSFMEGEPEWHDGEITFFSKGQSPLRM
ncbi:MAG: hypothetical protein HYY30_15070 [Chloroflexi bacterium]|nr:hypothetical protein [Chloroflexota bacterium]